MLLLGSKTMNIEGLTVFPDHADPSQFWYLPGPVGLARKGEDKEPAFTFIKYKPAAVAGGAKGGGFLNFEVSLHMDPAFERRILSKLSSVSKGEPKLNAVPFDEGTVQCIALNLQGSGGTTAVAAPPGTFNAVEKILGASIPSLFGDNSAAFSLTLSQEGAIIIEKAFQELAAPVGVVYSLKFTGLRPALDVKITADFKRIYNHFSASLSGQYYFIQAGIDAGFEKLVQEGAIKIEVTNFTTEGDRQSKEKWALDFFKEKLLSDWFAPTLTPGQLAGGMASSTIPSATGSTTSPVSTPKDGGGTKPSGAEDKKPTGTEGKPAESGTKDARQNASLQIKSTNPDPLPSGYRLTHKPSASGTTETLTVSGGANPAVQVEGKPVALDADGGFTVEVLPGLEKSITVEFPGTPKVQETFKFLFDFEKPLETGWPASLSGYLKNKPNPADEEFSKSKASSGNQDLRGADALQDWISNRLVSPKQVKIEANASYEGHPEKKDYNKKLSTRRLTVASRIAEDLATITSADAFGHEKAEAANRLNDKEDRNALITGTVSAEVSKVTINAKISRPKTPEEPKPPVKPPGETPPAKPPAQPTPPAATVGLNPAISLKIKFIRQEELKTVTLEYHSSEASQRTYAPQGFFGLLLSDLADKKRHFVEVDLDDPFFRVFAVALDAPIDFKKIGLTSADVAIDYGKPSDAAGLKHGDFVFDDQNPGPKRFEVFMNDRHDTSYTYQIQYHFDPGSDWEGQKFSYEVPKRTIEDRTLNLNPYEDIGFLEIKVFPNRIDKGIIDSTEVHLKYDDQKGFASEKTLLVMPDSPPQFWRLRLNDPRARSYTHQFVHHLKDGTTRLTEPLTTSALAVAVDDPFEGKLEIEFVPLLDPAKDKMAFVDVVYSDAENQYEREERLKFLGTSTDSVKLLISLLNPKRRIFRFRITLVGTDNQMRQGQFNETQETLIGVSSGG